jgi:hypothetical protein
MKKCEDKKRGKPSLLPGDIVKSKKSGAILVITQAKVIINGCSINWSDKLPDKIEHGWYPSYAVEPLPEYSYEKYAWWDLEELEVIELGPLHKYYPTSIDETNT